MNVTESAGKLPEKLWVCRQLPSEAEYHKIMIEETHRTWVSFCVDEEIFCADGNNNAHCRSTAYCGIFVDRIMCRKSVRKSTGKLLRKRRTAVG